MSLLRDLLTFSIGAAAGFAGGRALVAVVAADEQSDASMLAGAGQGRMERARIARDAAQTLTETAMTHRFRRLTSNLDALPGAPQDNLKMPSPPAVI